MTSFATEQAATGSVADMTPTDPAANAEENAAGSIAPATTELASTVLDSQAGEALQSTAGVDAKAESLGLQTLPFAETADGTLQFERDVVAALSIFQAGEDVAAFLANLPAYSVRSLAGFKLRGRSTLGWGIVRMVRMAACSQGGTTRNWVKKKHSECCLLCA